jgi:hypothetical protein
MKKYITILFLIFVCIYTAVGQTKQVGSPSRKLAQATNDTSRILADIEFAFAYYFYHSDSSLLLLNQTLASSQKLHFTKGELKASIGLGTVYRITGDYVKSLQLLFHAL